MPLSLSSEPDMFMRRAAYHKPASLRQNVMGAFRILCLSAVEFRS